MNDWFKKQSEKIKALWTKWTPLKKGIAIGSVVLVIVVIIVVARLSAKPATTYLFNAAVTEQSERDAILNRLDQDNVKAYVSNDGYISVNDDATAKKYRSILIAEGLAPSRMDAYSLFDVTRWSRNDFDDKVNWLRVTQNAVKSHLESLNGIRSAEVKLTLPDESLFSSTQKPVTASVILYAKGGSDVLENKKSVKGIQNLILKSVEGLKEENIVIVNGDTNLEINDFSGMEAIEQVDLTAKEQREILKLETQYSGQILAALKKVYKDRVQIASMKIDMDMSRKQFSKEEYSGITIKPDNKDTPYDDSEVVTHLELSSETIEKKFTGTGYNPEGPAGVEGQNPPVYSDMSNVIGEQTESGKKVNNALNKTITSGETTPTWTRITASVNIDGVWGAPQYDAEDAMEYYKKYNYFYHPYEPIPEEELKAATEMARKAAGYDKNRGDDVQCFNIPFDHTDEWKEEAAKYIKAQQTRKVIMYTLIGVIVVLLAFIIFRFISREIERRRRLREEELLRRQQAEREKALWEAKEQGMEVTMSVEERRRAELQENAIAMAKEHPEDVAMLIRTWLMEE